VDELKPKALLFENVRGLVTARDHHGRPGGVIKTILREFEDCGYSCRTSLLNAADYGSHQRRVRCFIVAVKHGVAPHFPLPTHARSVSGGVRGLFDDTPTQPWRTLGDFLSHHADNDATNWTRPTKQLTDALAGVAAGSGLISRGVVERTRPGGHWGYRQGTFIADPNLPARTVTGSSSQDWIRLDDGSLRRLTLREVARLQGFPDEWVLEGSKAEKTSRSATPFLPCSARSSAGCWRTTRSTTTRRQHR
jgi:DNA (cytosine-5)-methyltransferase 1